MIEISEESFPVYAPALQAFGLLACLVKRVGLQ